MAPRQCLACGRFLKNELVQRLDDGEQPCPRCGTALRAGMFGVADATRIATDGGPRTGGETASIRPPDLAPAQVRDDDVLAGWDPGADAAEIASWNRDRAPFPTDTAVVLAGTVLGALLGAAASPTRLRGAAIGGGVGLGVTATVRQVWRLRDGASA